MSSSPPPQLRFAVVCSSNQNRSMETHNILMKKGFNIRSFGAGEKVKLPGPSIDKPNIYDFNTTYDFMYNDLITKDKQLYTQNGILHMLDRNRRIKQTPERFQECKEEFDVIFTVEERVFDQVIEDLENREKNSNQLVHIINIDVADNHEDATLGAFMLLEFAQKLQNTEDLDNEIDELIQEFEANIQRTVLHTIAFY